MRVGLTLYRARQAPKETFNGSRLIVEGRPIPRHPREALLSSIPLPRRGADSPAKSKARKLHAREPLIRIYRLVILTAGHQDLHQSLRAFVQDLLCATTFSAALPGLEMDGGVLTVQSTGLWFLDFGRGRVDSEIER